MSLLPHVTPANDGRRLLRWFWFAIGYFALQTLARVLVSPAPELDEAEQLLWTRELAWGYGAQPPLYTWLQWAVFEPLGPSIAGLALLKNGLLALAYVALAWAAWPLVGASAGLVAAGMLWLPQIGWESQRDLTHTVLATTCAALALGLFVRIARAPRPWHYLVFGAVVGLGLLAKYNLLVFHALLVGCALAVPQLRPRLFSRWTLAALLVALLVVAPHLAWALQHLGEVTSGTARKMQLEDGSGLAARMLGLWSALRAAASMAAPWLLVFGLLVYWPARRAARAGAPAAQPDAVRRAVLAYFVLLALALAALALAGGVTHFKSRWMQPLLFLLPLAGWLWLPAPPPAAAERRYTVATLVLAALLLAGITLRAPLDGRRGQPDELNEPVGALAAELRTLVPRPDTLVVDPPRLAAGLRVQFPQARLLLADQAETARGTTVFVAAGSQAEARVRQLAASPRAPVRQWLLQPLYVHDAALAQPYAAAVLVRP
ncbi:hypothetical protein CKO44_05020 [Rubrivivax gelatinosus]|uniref:ArnT family glycosyltransferase n=1 Tax=Rubrivivax gelatinosus TaxID=28068 RepID=UPI001904C2F9|nr:glycosyltransferase family 39 protein [Rubrivivax gelatinosus]MBK1612830.1 hypothetical protein [Rubrivivax gelatinosus]